MVQYLQTCIYLLKHYRILQKYNLCYVLDMYILTGQFMPKMQWKQLLNNVVFIRNCSSAIERLNLQYTSVIEHDMFKAKEPCSLWLLSKRVHQSYAFCTSIVRALGKYFSGSYRQVCVRCNNIITNSVLHTLCFCLGTTGDVARLWDFLIESFGMEFFLMYISYSPEMQVQMLQFDLC